jgi:hypothetical protein
MGLQSSQTQHDLFETAVIQYTTSHIETSINLRQHFYLMADHH